MGSRGIELHYGTCSLLAIHPTLLSPCVHVGSDRHLYMCDESHRRCFRDDEGGSGTGHTIKLHLWKLLLYNVTIRCRQHLRSSNSHLTIAIAITPPTHCKLTPCNPYMTCSKESSNSARELAQWNPPASPPSPTRCSTFQISSAQKKKQQFSKRKGQTPIHTYGRIHYFHPTGT